MTTNHMNSKTVYLQYTLLIRDISTLFTQVSHENPTHISEQWNIYTGVLRY